MWIPLCLGLSFTIIATAASDTPSGDSASTYTNATKLQLTILNSTNTYRQQHAAEALVWNTSLASYAGKAVSSCRFAHSNGPNGENLAQGYNTTTIAIDAWANERALYKFPSPDSKDQGTAFSSATGHFTQLIWQATRSTGCAARACNPGGQTMYLLICEYWPPGNILNEFAANVHSQIDNSSRNGTDPVPVLSQSPGRKKAPAISIATVLALALLLTV